MKVVIVIALLGLVLVPFASAQSIPLIPSSCLGLVPNGGASGGDALYCNGGDLIGWRNIQGDAPNFDIGAGSTRFPGNINLNWDVGRMTKIYQGSKHLVASFGPSGSKFYNPKTGKLLASFGTDGIKFYVKPKITH